ncbi:MAG: hypothetical protein AB1567_00845 [bacterium]
MSGGHFDYQQFRLEEIATEIQKLIDNNDSDLLDEYSNLVGRHYSPETIEKFKEAVRLLAIAEIYVTRIDYLLSGDDNEESFHRRLKEDLKEVIETGRGEAGILPLLRLTQCLEKSNQPASL